MLQCEQRKKESKLDHLSLQNNPQTLTNLLRCSKILQNYKGGCFDLPNLPELRNFSKFSQISEIPLIFWQICTDFRFWLFLMSLVLSRSTLNHPTYAFLLDFSIVAKENPK